MFVSFREDFMEDANTYQSLKKDQDQVRMAEKAWDHWVWWAEECQQEPGGDAPAWGCVQWRG